MICFNDSELVQMYLQRAKLKHELVKIRAMDRPAAELEPEINKHNEKVEKFDEKLHKFKVLLRSSRWLALVEQECGFRRPSSESQWTLM